jgi:hypothetical protein
VLPLADLLPFSSAFYGALTGIGFLLGIALVFISTMLIMLAASSYDGGLPPDVKGDAR